jgi:hypothetical protein
MGFHKRQGIYRPSVLQSASQEGLSSCFSMCSVCAAHHFILDLTIVNNITLKVQIVKLFFLSVLLDKIRIVLHFHRDRHDVAMYLLSLKYALCMPNEQNYAYRIHICFSASSDTGRYIVAE